MARPDTPFELALGADWTSLADEYTLLQHLATDSGRVVLQQVGASSTTALPVYRVGIGATTPSVAAAKASGEAVLYIGGQHGDEPAGREALLTLARDLAYDTDPATTALLAARTVWIIPTLNPEGRAANRRYTDSNLDPNRDHLDAAGEGLAAQQSITDLDPVFVLDAHEMLGAVADELRLQTCLVPSADADLLAASNVMLDDLLAHAVGLGVVANPWPGSDSPDQFWKDAANPGMLHNSAGLRQRFTLLTETRGAVGDTPQERHDLQMMTFERTLTHFAGMRTVIDAAKARGVADLHTPVDLNNGYIVKAPEGYEVDTAAIAAHLTLFELAQADDVVPVRQAMQPLVPILFDPLSPDAITSAVRIYGHAVHVSIGGRWVTAQEGALV